MADVDKAVKVGLLTVALAGATVAGYRFVSRASGTAGGRHYYALLSDVTGIAPHSRVQISGIQVGVIERLSLEAGSARVDIRLRPDVVLYEDATVGKHATSLIGEAVVVLTPGTEGRPRIPDDGRISTVLSEPTLQLLENQFSDILKDVKAVTASLRDSVGTPQGTEHLAAILKNVAEATEQLNLLVRENRASVHGVITNVEAVAGDARPKVAEILENLKALSADVRELLAKPAAAGAPPGDLRGTAERIHRASGSLESLLQHAEAVVARVDRGEGTVGRLTKDETLINEVQGVVDDVSDLVGGVARLQTVVGLRTDYNFLASTVKSYVELRLQPSEDKYYVVELVNDPRGLTKLEQIDVDTTNPNLPPHYREVRTTTTNSFRFSLQFAKRFGPFTGRFGIKESTGGLGLDLHLLGDRFELRQDLFGFGEQVAPRWRVAVGYEFIRKLWLLGGVDDILNGARRDYFVGLQLRFNDQDLKMILPFLPKGM